MKKLLAGILLLVSSAVLAEPSFNDIQSLIAQRQYSAAESGLVEIIKNHPQSAKAYYTMAQAQAGLGNLEKARYALDKAQGLEPSLNFADSDAVRNLRQAISPQTNKIEAVPESNFWSLFFGLLVVYAVIYFGYRLYTKNKNKGQTGTSFGGVEPEKPWPRTPSPSGTGSSSRSTSSTRRTTKWSSDLDQQPQDVNHYHNNSDDLLTGVLLGEALANDNRSHDTVVVQQSPSIVTGSEYFMPKAQPAPEVDKSWDNEPSKSDYVPSVKSSSWDNDSSSSSKSSSWDSTPSKSSSSSWDDSSSSKSSSSSWDSGSSSSSSWDSGSSSSSSSSWD